MRPSVLRPFVTLFFLCSKAVKAELTADEISSEILSMSASSQALKSVASEIDALDLLAAATGRGPIVVCRSQPTHS